MLYAMHSELNCPMVNEISKHSLATAYEFSNKNYKSLSEYISDFCYQAMLKMQWITNKTILFKEFCDPTIYEPFRRDTITCYVGLAIQLIGGFLET